MRRFRLIASFEVFNDAGGNGEPLTGDWDIPRREERILVEVEPDSTFEQAWEFILKKLEPYGGASNQVQVIPGTGGAGYEFGFNVRVLEDQDPGKPIE